MRPLELVNLDRLMARSTGRSQVIIGLIDGPVSMDHPDLSGAQLPRSSRTAPRIVLVRQQCRLHARDIRRGHTLRQAGIFSAGHLSRLHAAGAADLRRRLPPPMERCRARRRQNWPRPYVQAGRASST